MKNFNHQQQTVHCTFKGYKDRFAILQTEDNFEYHWPIEKLPKNIPINDTIMLTLNTGTDQNNALLEAQRQLLEELIN